MAAENLRMAAENQNGGPSFPSQVSPGEACSRSAAAFSISFQAFSMSWSRGCGSSRPSCSLRLATSRSASCSLTFSASLGGFSVLRKLPSASWQALVFSGVLPRFSGLAPCEGGEVRGRRGRGAFVRGGV